MIVKAADREYETSTRKLPCGRFASFVYRYDWTGPATQVSFERHPTRAAAYRYAVSMAKAMAQRTRAPSFD